MSGVFLGRQPQHLVDGGDEQSRFGLEIGLVRPAKQAIEGAGSPADFFDVLAGQIHTQFRFGRTAFRQGIRDEPVD
jgi:hypothetical protein